MQNRVSPFLASNNLQNYVHRVQVIFGILKMFFPNKYLVINGIKPKAALVLGNFRLKG